MFDLNLSAEIPLNEQIVEKTKLMIAKGILANGDSMPSVRDLSKSLLINQSTVQKAYNKLKEEGILVSKPGLGTFVSIDEEKFDYERENIIKDLYQIFLKCKLYNINFDKIKEIYEKTREDI
ncbi:GntR family transcriptional regulator [Anaerococcus sp. AGMB00486]|uniref:GntR family transcriptional regulator n=2 Tax=Anaerococcus TaxID=165779 RepID=A0ABX2NBZ1_9FIRM|nr:MULTISPECIES: GntR family transcriptional regulator [Anaerococcus]MDY3006871.1 GntR family transcriptional regulator [Anaerococcus porci]MSS77802.1 GntR family transcriptional regulator [Anaerococcus porci]NVF12236.1 GntR family transcriptional regulator [Anaerococcus faecalis]